VEEIAREIRHDYITNHHFQLCHQQRSRYSDEPWMNCANEMSCQIKLSVRIHSNVSFTIALWLMTLVCRLSFIVLLQHTLTVVHIPCPPDQSGSDRLYSKVQTTFILLWKIQKLVCEFWSILSSRATKCFGKHKRMKDRWLAMVIQPGAGEIGGNREKRHRSRGYS
jgi:hypothetical protein